MTEKEYQKWYTELHREEKLKRSREWYLQNKEVYNLRRKKLFYYVSSGKVKKKFGTLQEVCDFMGYSKPTICRYIKAGRKLEGYKITKGGKNDKRRKGIRKISKIGSRKENTN